MKILFLIQSNRINKAGLTSLPDYHEIKETYDKKKSIFWKVITFKIKKSRDKDIGYWNS